MARWLFIFCLLASPLFAAVSPAEKPFLHGLFHDNMVLQRDGLCPIWGWTESSGKVTVSFQGKSWETVAGKDGKWLIRIDAFPAGGPYELTVKGKESVTLKNVMMGDVWLCSGQSNMEFGMKAVDQWWDEQSSADLPNLRLARVAPDSRFEAPRSVDLDWQVSSKDVVFSDKPKFGGFSAIAFMFGREVQKTTKVPIGLIESCWGATSIVDWSDPASLKDSKDFNQNAFEYFQKGIETYWKDMDPNYEASKPWSTAEFSDSAWEKVDLSGAERRLPDDFSGVVWLRREIEIPASWSGQEAILALGTFPDKDTCWWDGTFVDSGNNPDSGPAERFYKIPNALMKPGKHTLAVRVNISNGALGGGDAELQSMESPGTKIPLKGEWSYQKSTPASALVPKGVYPERRYILSGCYQGMIASLAPFAIKGVLWYQGEGDAGREGDFYHTQLKLLIQSWRKLFADEKMPFYLVQLSSFGRVDEQPGGDSGWARVREGQFLVSREISDTGLAVSIDRGEVYNIHPPNKKDVAQRLAAAVLGQVYGQKVEFLGPTYKSMQVEGGSIRLVFDGVSGGLVGRGGVPTGFEIAGSDGKYFWANAAIDGDTLVISSLKVTAPVSVRYGWADHPLCNLYNGAGFPASPFRTGK